MLNFVTNCCKLLKVNQAAEQAVSSTVYVPLNLSTLVDRLAGRQVDKYDLPIMPCTPNFNSGPVKPGRQVDRSTYEQVRLTHKALI